jgi:hypothetical protein
MPMDSYELRPLSLGELLDRAFLLYRRNYSLFAGVMIFPACLILPLRFFMLRQRGAPFPWEPSSPQHHALAYFFAWMVVNWIVYAVAEAATINAVADVYMGRRSRILEAYGKIRGRLWKVMMVGLAVYLRTLGMIVLFFLLAATAGVLLMLVFNRGSLTSNPPAALVALSSVAGFALGLLFSARYDLSLSAALLEENNGRAAIRRSVQLSRGHRGRIFLALLLGVVVSWSTIAVLEGPFYLVITATGIKGHLPAWIILGISISGTLGEIIASPLLMIVMVLFYYDLRIRKEAFDLQQMMASLPEAPPGAAVSPA